MQKKAGKKDTFTCDAEGEAVPGLEYGRRVMRRRPSLLGVLSAWLLVSFGCSRNPAAPSASDWQEVESPTTRTLWSVVFLQEDEGWAVGDSGTIVYYDGANWSTLESPTTADLRSAYFCSSTDGWAIGMGVILHYDGTEWHEAFIDGSAEFYSVWFTAPGAGWVVGRRKPPAEPYSFVLHYDGTEWSEQKRWSEYSGLCSVRFVAENDGWIGGSPVVLHFDGSEWRVSHVPSGTIWGLYFSSVSDGWAASMLPVPSNGDTVRSRILRYDGSSWHIAHESTSSHFLSLFFPASTRGWAGGSDIVYYDGNRWDVIVNGADITSLYFLSEDEGWAVGWHGRILHYECSSGL